MEAAACAKPATGYTYARREPEKTALFQVIQQHLLTFEQEWTDEADGRTLPSFVTDELHDFLDCGILGTFMFSSWTVYTPLGQTVRPSSTRRPPHPSKMSRPLSSAPASASSASSSGAGSSRL
ncbi:MAG TPA: hypothetical protein VJ860_13690 [Polyangia bacterium]|jgi:hypothetical protein|nr:hypothetical protein [Polyangia bacterium]